MKYVKSYVVGFGWLMAGTVATLAVRMDVYVSVCILKHATHYFLNTSNDGISCAFLWFDNKVSLNKEKGKG